MQPLNQRVTAPERVDLPIGPEGVHWRPATKADVPALHEVEKEVSAVDHPHYTITEEEFEDDLDASYIDAELDTLLATAADGRLLAWGSVIASPGQATLVRTIIHASVRPSERGRGIGRRLLAWQVARAEQRLAASDKDLPGWIMAYIDDSVTAAKHLYERAGLGVARYFLELGRDLAAPIPDLGEGIEIVRFGPEHSERVHAAVTDSFRDHWASQPMSDEQWEKFVGRSTFRPDLGSVAIVDGEVAGFVLASVIEEDWAGQGFSSSYIDLVGVPRAFRGRGIAPALLAASMRLMAAEGLERAVLDVDSDSPTGALGLYTKVGFAESNRSVAYNRVY